MNTSDQRRHTFSVAHTRSSDLESTSIRTSPVGPSLSLCIKVQIELGRNVKCKLPSLSRGKPPLLSLSRVLRVALQMEGPKKRQESGKLLYSSKRNNAHVLNAVLTCGSKPISIHQDVEIVLLIPDSPRKKRERPVNRLDMKSLSECELSGGQRLLLTP